MKRVLLILSLFCMLPFLGHSQDGLSFGNQLEEGYGPAPYAKNPTSVSYAKDAMALPMFGSLVPSDGNGKVYNFDADAATMSLVENESFTGFYFLSAEIVKRGSSSIVYGYGSNNKFYAYDRIAGQRVDGYPKDVTSYCTDLAYDMQNDKMYGLLNGKIYLVDLTTGAMTVVNGGTVGSNNWIALAINKDGKMYGVTNTLNSGYSKLYQIKSESTWVASYKFSTGLKTKYSQSMSFDRDSDRLFWWHSGDGQFNFCEIDLTAKTVTTKWANTGTQLVGINSDYAPLGHTLTIYYKYKSSGETAATKYTASYAVGVNYSVESPTTVVGHEPDKATVTGVMGETDIVETVYYTPKKYTLTVNFTGAGEDTPETHTEQVTYNTTYTYNTPAVTGYTADKTVITGTMPAEDVTETVTYSINSYDLTIHYKYSNGSTAAADHHEVLNYKAAYSVVSPVIEGYTADQTVVEGTMPADNVEVTVYYAINPHVLTIKYFQQESGEAPTLIEQKVYNLDYGQAYSYPTPEIECYTPDKEAVTGIMPDSDVIETVLYTKNSHTLTVRFVDSEDNDIATPSESDVYCGETYNIPAATVTGYAPREAAVTGTMPDADVERTIIYDAGAYTITVIAPNDGTLEAEVSTAHYGDNVAIIVTEDDGMELDWLTYEYNGEDPIDITELQQIEEMPAANVTVKGAFKQNGENTISIGDYQAFYNEVVTVEVALDNENFVGYAQMDVIFGSNVTYVENSAALTARAQGTAWTLNEETIGSGATAGVRVTITNSNNEKFDDIEGAIFTFQVRCGYNTAAEPTTGNALTVENLTCKTTYGTVLTMNESVAGNITINQTEYNITYATAEHGEVTGDETSLAYEEVNSLTVTPDACYHLNTLYYIEEGSSVQHAIDIEEQTFTMPANDITVYATFEINVHTLTINYLANGEEIASQYTEDVNCGAAYSVVSPVVTCMTPDQATVSGTMPDEDVTVNVNYTTNVHTLTVTYVGAGEDTPEPAVLDVNCGDEYQVVTPVLAGFTADIAVVEGTMPDENVNVTVTYTRNGYAITIGATVNGTIATDPASTAAFEQLVNVQIYPEVGFELATLTYTVEGEAPVDIFDDQEFYMPAADVTVNATFTQSGVNTLAIEDQNVYYRDLVEIPVLLENENNIAYAEMTISLGELTYNSVELNTLRAVDPSWAITAEVVAGNKLHVVVNNTNNAVFVDNTNKAIFTVKATADIVDSENEMKIEGVVTKTVAGTVLTTTAVEPFGKIYVTSPDYTITYAEMVNGTVTGPAGSDAYETVTLTVTPDACYHLNTLYYIEEGSSEQQPITGNTFTMPTHNVTVYATFAINVHTMTVTYAGAGEDTPDPVAMDVNCGEPYEVATPVIACYTPDQTVVEGTMPDEDVNVTVTYTINVHTLTVTYVGAGEDTPEPAVLDVNCGEEYQVVTPVVEGYSPDIAVVEGIMPDEDVNVTVTYTRIDFNITVIDPVDGTLATLPAAVGTYGNTIEIIATPNAGFSVKEYTVVTDEGTTVAVTGNTFVMPADNVTVSVEFEQSGVNTLAIEDQSVYYRDLVEIPVLLENENNIAYAEMYISLGELTYSTVELNTLRAVDPSWTIAAEVLTGNKLHVVVNNTNNAVFADNTNKAIFTVKATAGIVDSQNEMKIEGIVTKTVAGTEVTTTAVTPYGIINVASPDYTITYAEMVDGTVTGPTASKAYETVTLTVTPDECHHLVSLTYTVDGEDPVAIEGNSFTMPTANVTINATFEINVHTLTVTYVGVGEDTPDPVVMDVNCGEPYEVATPVIACYTPDQTVVEGTMPDEDVNVTVTYTINVHTLTVTYVGADDYTPDPYENQVNCGEAYEVETPVLTGFTADIAVVEGTMPDEDVNVTVTYTRNSYNITIGATVDGTIATDPANTAAFEQLVNVQIYPEVGFELATLTYTVEGESPVDIFDDQEFYMPAADVTVNATFTQSGVNTLAIEDQSVYYRDLVEIPVLLENENNIAYAEMYISLGELTYSTVELNTLRAVDPSWTIAAEVLTGNKLHVVVNNTNNAVFADNTNKAIFTVKATAGIVDSQNEMKIEGIVTKTVAGTEVTTTAVTPYGIINVASPDYTITYAEMVDGTVTGPTASKAYETVTLTVTPDECHHLVSLTYTVDGEDPVAIEGNSFTMPTANVTINATFEINVHTLTVTYVGAGALTPEPNVSNVNCGAQYSVATPEILGYTPDIAVVEGIMPDNDHNVTVTYNHDVYTITYAQTANGTIEGQTWAYYQDEVEITTTPDEGYHFVEAHYTAGTSAPVAIVNNVFTMPLSNVTVDGTFEINTYNINAVANPTVGGTITGAGVYEHFQTATLVATAGDDYVFVNWTENGEEVWNKTTYSFEVTGERNIVANFANKMLTVNAYAYSPVGGMNAGGTVTGGGTYYIHETVTLEETPATGYVFKFWYDWMSGEILSTETTYSFEVLSNREIRGVFASTVNVKTRSNGHGITTGDGEYNVGEEVTVTATPQPGYVFTGWYDGDDLVSEESTYTFVPERDIELEARFEEFTGVDENANLNAEVYPNPTKGSVKVDCEGMQRIVIVSMLGTVVYDNSVVYSGMTIDMSAFAQGAYVMNIVTNNGTVQKTVVLTR